MSELNYTKGEWAEHMMAGERNIVTFDPENGLIAEVICRDVRHWNKDIIKASPKMYEVLKGLEDAIKINIEANGIHFYEHWLPTIRKALDKAEGK